MSRPATDWTSLERRLSASPDDWPTYVCPAGHEVAIAPFSRLWDKETGHLLDCPVCYDCEKAKRALPRAQPHPFTDRETALRAHGVPATCAREPFQGGLPRVLGHDLADWIGGPGAWALVLHGVVGAGKSMLAAELLWRRLPDLRTAAWWRASLLLDALLGSLSEETKARAHRDRDADLLVIDDLGHVLGDRGFEVLYNVLTPRQDDERPTLITLDEPLLTFCQRQWPLGAALTRGTLPVPFRQTYAQRTAPEASHAGQSVRHPQSAISTLSHFPTHPAR